MLARMGTKGNPCTLLLRMKIGAATMEHNVAVSPNNYKQNGGRDKLGEWTRDIYTTIHKIGN